MNFLSLQFAVFFLILFAIIWLVRDLRVQNIILLIASYLFYAFGDIRFLVLLVFVSFAMWFLGKRIKTTHKKAYLICGIAIDLFVLGIFKYFNFFMGSLCNLFNMSFTALNILLPLGISFYIFQSISYLADVYMGKIETEDNPLNVLLYIGFFPQIMSGPIVKANYFLPQLRKSRETNFHTLSLGAQLFLLGAFKKVVIADHLAVVVDSVYKTPVAYSSISVLLAVISYSLQIYYDFSGYSDMAIGVATALGFDLGKNFNLPYLAKNPSDFWRRWHISLSSWFRDYVYFPLGGSRRGRLRTYINLFITMLLSGLWHGASWAFVFWGAMHALLSVVHKIFADLLKSAKKTKPSIWRNGIAIALNYICVSLLWIPFRTNSLNSSITIIKHIFAMKPGVIYISDFSVIFILILLIIQAYALIKNNGNNPFKYLDLSKFWNKVIFICAVIITFVFSYVGNTAFIYAQF